MSKLVRRIIALVLGTVIGATALVGGVTGGAMWAYRNVKPLEMLDNKPAQEGTLQDSSIEDLVQLLQAAKSDPSKYDVARLEEEYGLSLADVLEKFGVDISQVDEKDLEALRNITLFSIFDEKGMDKFLSSVKVRSLYVFMSAMSGKSLDSIMSKEAQEIIGEKTLKELFTAKEGSGYIGIMEVLRELKLGAFFPAVYDAVYDENKHEYNYVIKEELKDKRKGLVTLMGDMPISALFNLMDGSSITKEFLEGGLRYLSEKPLAEVLSALGENIGVASAKESMNQLAKALGDEVTLLDIITRGENGEYLFDYNEALRNFNIGYLLGYHLGDDGNWYSDDALTEKVDGMMGILADMKLAEVFDGSETVDMIKAMFGDVSLMTFFETFAKEGDEVPALVELLKDMTVNDILAAGTDGISKMLVDNLDLYLSKFDLGTVLDGILSDEMKETIDNSNILTALMGINLGDFIKKEYNGDVIMKGLANALDELTLGQVVEDFGAEDFWTDKPILEKLFNEITVSDIINLILGEEKGGTTVEEVFDHITLGDVFGALYGYEKNEAGIWAKGDKTVTEDFNGFLETTVISVIQAFVNADTSELEASFNALTFGDILYSFLSAAEIDIGLVYEDGKVYIENEKQYLEDFSAILLGIEIGEFIENYQNEEWWAEKIGSAITVGDIFGMIYGYEKNEAGVWAKGDKVVTDGFNTFLDNTLYSVIKALMTGETAELEASFNALTFGDIIYSFTTAAEFDIGIFYEDGIVYIENEKQYFEDLSIALLGIEVGDFIENYQDIDWWEEKIGSIVTLGDVFSMLYGYEKNEEGAWVNGDKIVTEDFNTFLGTSLFSVIKALVTGETTDVEEAFNSLTFGDLFYSLLEAAGSNPGFVYEDGKVYFEESLSRVSAIAMSVQIGDFLNNYQDGDWWRAKFGEIVIGDLIADFVNNSGDEETRTVYATYDAATDKWVVTSEKLPELLNNIYNLKVTDVIDALDCADFDFFIDVFGETEVFDLIDLFDFHYIYGFTLTKLYSTKVKDIFYAIKYYNDKEAENYVSLEELVGDITLGDVFGDLYGYAENAEGDWVNGDKVVTARFNDALDITVLEVILALAEKDDSSLTAIYLLTPGDILYSFLEAYNNNDWLVYEDGVVKVKDFVGRATEALLNTAIGDYLLNYNKYKWWLNTFGEIDIGDIVVDLFNYVSHHTNLVLYGERDAETDEWIVHSLDLQEFFTNIYNVKIAEIYDALNHKDYDFFIELLGDTTIRNIVDMLTKKYRYGNVLTKLMEIKLKDVVYTLKGDKTWTELLGVITLGEVFGDIYGYSLNDENVWSKGEKVVTDGFNTFLELDLVSVIKSLVDGVEPTLNDAFNQLTPGDILYSMLEALDSNKGGAFAYENGKVTYTKYLTKVSEIALNTYVGEYRINYYKYKWWVEKFGDCYIGDFLADIANEMAARSEIYFEATFDEVLDLWTVDATRFANFFATTFNAKVNIFADGIRSGIKTMLERYLVGDIIADPVEIVLSNLGVDHDFEVVDNIYEVTGRFEVALEKLYNDNLYNTIDTLRDASTRKAFFNEFLVGDFLGDALAIVFEKTGNPIGYGYIYDATEDYYTVLSDYAALPIEKTFNAHIGDYLDVLSGGRAGVVDFYGDLRIGDFINEIVTKVTDKITFNGFEYSLEKTPVYDGEKIVTYDYEATGWYKVFSEAVLNMSIRDADVTFSSIQGIKNFVFDFKVGDLAADLIKFVAVRSKINTDFDYVYVTDGNTYFGNTDYYVFESFFDLPLERAMNATVRDMKDVLSGGRDSIVEFFGDLKLGDFYGKILAQVSENINFFGFDYEAYELTSGETSVLVYDYTSTGLMKVVSDTLANMTVSEANATFASADDIKNFFLGFRVGDYICDLLTLLDNYDGGYEYAIPDDSTTDYVMEGDYAVVLDRIVNVTLSDFKDGLADGAAEYLLGTTEDDGLGNTVVTSYGLLGDLFVGNLFGKGRYENVGGVWMDENGLPVEFANGATGVIMKHVYGKQLWIFGDFDHIVENLLGGLFIGDLNGYTAVDVGGTTVWIENNTIYDETEASVLPDVPVEVTGVNAIIANKELVDLMSGISITSLLGTAKLGEVFGKIYDEGTAKWYDVKKNGSYKVAAYDDVNGFYRYVPGNASDELYQAVCGISASDLFGPDPINAIMDPVKDVKIGYIMGYTSDDGVVWYDGGTLVTGINNKVAGITVNDLTGTGLATIMESWKVGELMGATYDGANWIKGGSVVEGINAKLYDLTILQLKGDFNAIIGDWQLGEVLGKYTDDGGTTWYNVRTGTPGAYVYSDPVTGLTKKILAMTIDDLKSDLITEINGWYVGDLLNLYYNEANETWYEDNTMTVPAKGVIGLLAGMTVGGLSNSTAFRNTVNGWFIGHVLEYNKYDDLGNVLTYNSTTGKWEYGGVEKTGKWKKEASDEPDERIQDFYDITVGELINGDFAEIVSNIVSEWKVGMLLGYYEYGSKWFRTRTGTPGSYVYDDEVTGITAKFADYKISQISADGGLKTIIDDFTISDVLGDVSSNPVLNAIKDSKISDLVDDINDIYLGDIMGLYTDDHVTWYTNEGKTVKADVLTNKVAGYQISDIDTLMDGVNDMYLGDIMGLYTNDHVTWYTDSGKTVKADVLTNKMAGFQIGDIGDLQDGINDMYLGEVMGLEKLKADYDDTNKVYIYNASGTEYWVKRLVTDTKANVYDSYPTTYHTKTVEATTYYYQYDELLAVLAKYQVKDISNGTMVNSLLDDVKGMKVKNFFDQSESGLMSMVDPEWTIEDLPTELDNKMDNAKVIKMIRFGAFGDYYPTTGLVTDDNYLNASGAGYESYDDTDEIFKSTPAADSNDDDEVSNAEARYYWLITMKMNDFMGEMMTSLKDMSDNMIPYYKWYVLAAGGISDYNKTALAYNKYVEFMETKGYAGVQNYESTLNYYNTYLAGSGTNDYHVFMKGYREYMVAEGTEKTFIQYLASL